MARQFVREAINVWTQKFHKIWTQKSNQKFKLDSFTSTEVTTEAMDGL